ncbi:hypothetical protein PENSPDRAFT_682456 [Peniophora sp. CONT]|nr:hypothetical protein PENSPDRAFT_682456 [Peniophora sp. CONT]
MDDENEELDWTHPDDAQPPLDDTPDHVDPAHDEDAVSLGEDHAPDDVQDFDAPPIAHSRSPSPDQRDSVCSSSPASPRQPHGLPARPDAAMNHVRREQALQRRAGNGNDLSPPRDNIADSPTRSNQGLDNGYPARPPPDARGRGRGGAPRRGRAADRYLPSDPHVAPRRPARDDGVSYPPTGGVRPDVRLQPQSDRHYHPPELDQDQRPITYEEAHVSVTATSGPLRISPPQLERQSYERVGRGHDEYLPGARPPRDLPRFNRDHDSPHVHVPSAALTPGNIGSGYRNDNGTNSAGYFDDAAPSGYASQQQVYTERGRAHDLYTPAHGNGMDADYPDEHAPAHHHTHRSSTLSTLSASYPSSFYPSVVPVSPSGSAQGGGGILNCDTYPRKPWECDDCHSTNLPQLKLRRLLYAWLLPPLDLETGLHGPLAPALDLLRSAIT